MNEQPRCDCGKRSRAACLAWGCGNYLPAKPDPQISHAQGCWSWGPAHYLCAHNEIKRLRFEEIQRHAKESDA